MEVNYKGNEIRKLCEQGTYALRKLGNNSAKKLSTRLAEFEAAQCVSELCAGKPHPLEGNRKGEFSVSLAGGDRVVFESSDEAVPRKKDGGIDWDKVCKISITEIGDYHD